MTSISAPRITDVALITHDFDGGMDFYLNKLRLELRSYVPGFADFNGPGIVLALWDAALLRRGTGIPARGPGESGHGVMIACELESPDAVDSLYREYSERGIQFYDAPKDFPWNAHCVYFAGPNGEFWELFAWNDGGQPGLVAKSSGS